jgi:hypothetical protein
VTGKEKGNSEVKDEGKIFRILEDLKNWDSVPEIVQKHLKEQEDEFQIKRVE